MATFAMHRLDSQRECDDGDHPHTRLPYNLKKPYTLFYYYAVDWIAGIVVAVLTLAVSSVKLHARFYEPADPSFSYPYEEDTISVTMLAFIGGAIPVIVMIIAETLLVYRARTWPILLDSHHFVLGLLQAHGLGQLATQTLKITVGRLRPSAFGRQEVGVHGWNMSFPSGHTSLSFGGLAYLALFLAGKTGVFSQGGMLPRKGKIRSGDPFRGSFTVGLLVVVAPFTLATYVGATRLIDYAHDFSDVNAGAVIGTVCAWYAYFCNFPSVTDSLAALPRPLAHLHRSDPDWIRYYRDSTAQRPSRNGAPLRFDSTAGERPPQSELASSFSPGEDLERGARRSQQ